ncbi:MAG: hypothetical protein PHQ04_08975 [Opitutaceae bacterium]|nr:hypothetical protein [Opitutaceae bacterium]
MLVFPPLARPLAVVFMSLVWFVGALLSAPLTRQFEIDFGRDVPSRNLKGLATRSDGRIVSGPTVTDLNGPPIADILWCVQPAGDSRFLVGTGPEGKIVEVTLAPARAGGAAGDNFAARLVARLEEPQVFALQRLPGGDLLAGTSPVGALYLIKNGQVTSRVILPVDSVFCFLALPDGSVLAATGNPGAIYRIDPARLAGAGVNSSRISDPRMLAEKGITLFGEIRDRNVRRLALLPSGRVIAGSSPKGNVYSFEAAGGPPVILLENRDTEAVDILSLPDGSFYAALVATSSPEDRRISARPPVPAAKEEVENKSVFTGRSSLAFFPAEGFPEIVASRSGVAFYRLAHVDGRVLITAGEQGDIFGYDPQARLLLVYAGSSSGQLNDLTPLDGAPGRYLLLRNNAAGLAVVDFGASGLRELETRRLDLGVPAALGQLRFIRLRGLDSAALTLQARVSYGSDEMEGWSNWAPLVPRDGAFSAAGLRGRYVRLKVTLNPAAPSAFEIDKATLYDLPQNRRPQLTEFRIFSPGLGLVPAPEPPPPAVLSLGQFLNPAQGGAEGGGDKRKATFLTSQLVALPANRIVMWTVTDPDGDLLAYTFSIRREPSVEWTDLAVDTRDNYLQFDMSPLPDGVYLTRLTVTEQAPRPAGQRLSYVFETDNLIIDKTPPEITEATAMRTAAGVEGIVGGRDTLSLLYGIELNFNNGYKETTEHPVDGILDSREENFAFDVPADRIAGATAVEVVLYDAAGNRTARRLPLPHSRSP